MKSKPLVSVIITTYNEQKNIANILNSLEKQTYKDIEVIVVDDGSSDATVAIAEKYDQVKVYKRPHRERSIQRNFGAEKSNGAYVLFLDCDMILLPEVISECVNLATSNNYVGIIIPEKSIGEGYWAKVKELERGWYEGDSSIEAERFFLKKTFIAVGGYNNKITGPEDWDLPKRTRKLGKFGRIKTYLLHNEGKQSFIKMIRKKYYYAQKLSVYLKSHQQSALDSQQVYFLRKGIYTNIYKIWKNPPIYIGLWILLICQSIAGLLGYIIGKWHKDI